MNIFKAELRANRKALIIWCVCMALLVLSGLGKYTAYASGGNSSDVFDQLPHNLKILLGFQGFEVTKLSGFYAFLFPYLEIATAIHAALLGSSIISKEERDKTTEFLIAKPISRARIITSKLLAALANVIILNLVSLGSSLGMSSTFDTGEDISGEILVLHLIMLLVQLLFLSLGALLASSMRKSKRSGAIAADIVILGYMISKVTELVEQLKFFNVFSPFTYFDLQKAVYDNEISTLIGFLCLGVCVIFAILAYIFYQRRDMNI